MRREFSNDQAVVIDSGNPSTVTSSIEVADLPGNIRDVNVMIDIRHTWTNDLRIHLVSPNGTRVLLVGGEGGRGDHFRRTMFDDAATTSIEGAAAPFRGVFRPEESLIAFNGNSAAGTWTLEVQDTAFQDGGSIDRWSLSIETCAHVFDNNTRVTIDAGAANVVTSSIHTGDLGGLVVGNIAVMVDIDHTWDDDLKLTLIGPDGTSVVLVDREGGDQDGFDHTIFDDAAQQSITEGSAPFAGRFRPEQPLAAFHNRLVSGTWTLRIDDQASLDGGMLNRWELIVESCAATPRVDTNFNIEVEFVGGLNANQRSVFELAAARWAEVIVGDLPTAVVDGREIDDLLIQAEGRVIDGPSGVLGSAGPRVIRLPSNLPITGEMTFDTADLADMEQEGTLIDVILHEMGHVLGIGTLWEHNELLTGSGTSNPEFVGTQAMAEYAVLRSETASLAVPVANTGGAGTAEGHWRETTFEEELMTGFVEQGEMPLSRMTIASLEDLGYEVNRDAADFYQLPATSLVEERQLTARRRRGVPNELPGDLDGGRPTRARRNDVARWDWTDADHGWASRSPVVCVCRQGPPSPDVLSDMSAFLRCSSVQPSTFFSQGIVEHAVIQIAPRPSAHADLSVLLIGVRTMRFLSISLVFLGVVSVFDLLATRSEPEIPWCGISAGEAMKTRSGTKRALRELAESGTDLDAVCATGCAVGNHPITPLTTAERWTFLADLESPDAAARELALDTLLFHGDATRHFLASEDAARVDPAIADRLQRELAFTHARVWVRVVDEQDVVRAAIDGALFPIGRKEHVHASTTSALQSPEVSGTVHRTGAKHLWARL